MPHYAAAKAPTATSVTTGARTSWKPGRNGCRGTIREANTDEVSSLKQENKDLKQAVAELYLRAGSAHNYLSQRESGEDRKNLLDPQELDSTRLFLSA
jgi:hypothetical protein